MSEQDSADLISLPQGGGALKGIGETFSPDLHMGTGNYRVPLEVPPGRHGLQPKLALAYSTGSPNGPFGLGWSLDVPTVQRRTSRGIPRYDAGDVFVLSGAEDLVPVPGGGPGQTRYRPRTEGLFARIEHHTEVGADYWTVWTRDGLRSVYGTPPPAAPPSGWLDPAIVVDPADPARRRILAWRLTATVDTLGNRVEYAYAPGDPGDAQLYLSEVRYADYGDPASLSFLVSVRLRYEVRPDPFTDRRGGFAVRTSRRCTAIETWTQAGQPVLARTVHLDYLDGTAANGVSLLGHVHVEGHDGQASLWMPPVEFAYTAWTPQARRYRPIPAPTGGPPSRALGRPGMDLVDLFGDGLPAVVELDGQARYWRNAGGTLEAPHSMRFTPAGASLGQAGVQLADFDGDGRADLLVTDARGAGYYPLAGDGGFDPSGYVRLRQAPTFDLTDPLVRLVDLDGDGIIDALRTGGQLELFYNDRLLGFDRVDVRRRGAEAPDVAFSDPRVKLADMTGDGLTDLVLVHDRHVQYWPYAGYGRWGQPVTMANAPAFEDSAVYGTAGHDPRRVLLGDVDGDGCADVVYVGDGHVTVWINRTGGGFADPVVIRGTPPVTDAAAVRLADMLGTGTAGVLWTYDQGTERGSTYKFLDLTGGVKPYLLASIDNHMGATTTIEYGTSTDQALADRRAGRPWRTTLPFPMHVVARVTVSDYFSQSKQVSELRYHHGYWDGAEREFRGFGRTDRRDTLGFGGPAPGPVSAPTELRSWFHLGPVGPEFGAWRELDLSDEFWPGDPQLLGATDTSALPAGTSRRALRDAIRALRGSTLRTELYGRDGTALQDRPYTVTERQHCVLPVLDGRPAGDLGWDAQPVVFTCQLGERSTQWERGSEPRTSASFTAGHDAYGRPSVQIEAAVPRATDPRASRPGRDPYLATSTRTQYATRDDAAGYLVDRVAVEERVEVVNDGSLALLGLRDAILAGTLSGPVRSLELTYYDGTAFQGLPTGQLGDHGLKVRSEHLALTAGILLVAYQSGDPTAPLPPYLPQPAAGQPAWTAEYPPQFQALVPAGAGYTYQPELAPHRAGWYAQTERTRYDVQDGSGSRGMMTGRRDPLGSDTTIAYDQYQLLVASETDALGMARTATYDYRVLQPAATTDVNGNRTQVGYTPLGLPGWIALTGQPGANEGDTVDQPGTLFEYGLTAWDDSPASARQPSWTHTTRRVEHRWQLVADVNQQRAQQGQPPLTDAEIAALFPADERSRFPERFIRKQECSDGFGRLAQTRTQAADVVLDQLGLTADLTALAGDAVAHQVDPAGPPAVVVSGWQVYDDKGRVVEKWEPFLAAGWAFQVPAPDLLATLARQTSEYDPRGLAVRVIGPDGSEQRVVPGVPADLTDPTRYQPTPWESYTYDANDNAGRTHPQQSQAWSSHWNTPSSTVEDALGRVIQRVERTDAGALTTRNVYDVDGNLLQVADPLGRTASFAVFDLLKRAWRQDLLDAGAVRNVFDAAGSALERRDARGAVVLTTSDTLHRPVRRWASDAAGATPTLRELTVYGDDQAGSGLSAAAAAAANVLGRPWAAYDEAGLVHSTRYDLGGNLLERVRQVLQTGVLLAGLPAPGGSWSGTALRVDWEPPAGLTLAQHAAALLDPTPYALGSTYDALGRRTSLTLPVDVTGVRHRLGLAYDRGGTIAGIDLDGTPYVTRIVYNTRGQRVVALLGCGTMIRYVRDPATFRLIRLRSEPYQEQQALRWRGGGQGPAQDVGYAYDLVGNVLAVLDRTPASGVPVLPDRLDRAFTYDPLYRLTTATGRECDVPPATPWAPDPRCADPSRARAWSEAYQYDPVGNLLHLAHQAGPVSTTRDVTLQAGSNRLATVVASGTTYAYAYDQCGNLVSETTSRLLEWDHANRLATFRTQAVGADPTLYAQHRYDSSGQRVLKVVRNQGGQLRVVVYVEGAFERLALSDATGTSTHDTVHVMDATARVALVKLGPPPPDDATPAVTYHLADQLGSSNVVVDGAGAPVNREEYTPFGETSFGSYARKRYRYTGRERDEESGFAYHDARFYAPWLGRWISTDPLGLTDGVNGYLYARANPMRLVDTAGTRSEEGGGGSGVSIPVTAVEVGAGPTAAPAGETSWVPRTATLDAVEGVGRAAATSGATITEQSIWTLHWSTRGFLLEDLAGNNVGKTFPLVDYVDSNVVRQIKSIDSSNLKYVRSFVRKAARDALEFIKRNPVAQAGKDAEVLAVMKTGTAREVVDAARNALGGSKQLRAAVRVVKGLPGKIAGAFQVLGTAAGVWSAYELVGDWKRGDAQAGVGNALNAASTGLSLGARGLAAAGVSGTAAAAASAVVGAGAVGWTIGTLINSQLSEETQNLIGGTLNQIVYEGGWKHPFGLGW